MLITVVRDVSLVGCGLLFVACCLLSIIGCVVLCVCSLSLFIVYVCCLAFGRWALIFAICEVVVCSL